MSLVSNTSRTLDFVRANRSVLSTDLPSTLYVAFAKDAVAWAAPAGGHAPANLTAWQLRNIYACNYTNWQQIDSALPNATIHPVVPGSRWSPSDTGLAFFRALSSLSPGYPWSFGDCVTGTATENDGTAAELQDPDALVPYSAGHYVGQVYGGHTGPGDQPGSLTLRSVDGQATVDQVGQAIAAPFAASRFGYLISTAVRAADWNASDAHTAALRSIFGVTGWICSSIEGRAIIRSYGFRLLPAAACGSTAHT
ncbi:substrate-binding domain-containing protein [Kitasatospora purpeofusca]|uniref:substrate-binding domain-containing protein n=1 Tax=Kitasatospora purpeofusca TaxID=67352 RepID=UPI0035DAEC53